MDIPLHSSQWNRQHATRRNFLKGVAFTACQWVLPSWGQDPHTIADPFSLSVSRFFGLTADHRPRDAKSLYTVHSNSGGRLSFDVSNNSIGGCLDEQGDMVRSVIQTVNLPCETISTPVGAYVDRLLTRGAGWHLQLKTHEKNATAKQADEWIGLDLADNLFPLIRRCRGPLLIETLYFAPMEESDLPAPNLLLTLIKISVAQGSSAAGTLSLTTKDLSAQLYFFETSNSEFEFNLENGQSRSLAIVYSLSPESDRATTAANQLRKLKPTEWFHRTQTFHRNRFGVLTIAEDPFYSELYVRASELARQSITFTQMDEFGGSFVGSDEPASSTVWIKDCFYEALAQCAHAPHITAKAIEFFLRWSIPTHTLGEAAQRKPDLGAISNSLGNSLSALLLAAMHYQYTGDTAFYLRHPELLTRGEAILNAVLASRRFEPYLFPSLYVSDGEARGDFHTGSNIAAWKAFHGMARLAREVYSRPDLAEEWQTIAEKIHASLLDYCVVQARGGPHFAEGAMADRSFILAHDGEESDTTLMPFYGFCETDDRLYNNTAIAAMSRENPYYAETLEGVWWFAHGKWSSATFPGWTTALAAAENETEMLTRLERIRSLTDADGSFWWWPYKHDNYAPESNPARVPGKCGWAAGVYQCLFLHNILGLTLDMPTRSLRVRPFIPWQSFIWKRCHIGSAYFDFNYRKTSSTIELEICNRNVATFQTSFELLLPVGASVSTYTLDGVHAPSTTKYSNGRILVSVSTAIKSGECSSVKILYTTV